jgi:hypothetical protein
MTATRSLTLALLCGSLVVPAGCTRTSDGTVVMAQPVNLSLGVPSFLQRKDRNEAPAAAATAFPPAPRQAAPAPRRAAARNRVVPRVSVWRPTAVAAPFIGSRSDKPLTCHDETGANGRVRVVCE